ncbi:MAG: ASKHA domain-containing protein [candidate division WOR-3 bacterium]|nr:ASKHA domain-containing protein [candidate division WOR-3 bacterium]
MKSEFTSLLTLLQKKGIFIDAACGGKGRCGRCRVFIGREARPPDEIEKVLIPCDLLKKGYRLACRYFSEKIPETLIIPEQKKKSHRKNKHLGMAIDIGTTVIKGALVDLNESRIVKMAKVYNPQQSFGGDVLTRVGLANDGKYRLLKRVLRNGIEDLKERLNCSDPSFTVIVGNPVMLSFYLGKPVKNFGCYPFQGTIKRGIFLKKPASYVFGCIGGFVGGDTISGLIASGLLNEKKPSLYIDLGTNGEIALVKEKKIYVLSTSAGPAFEGVGLSSGTLAIPGAIERVDYKNGFKISTIGNEKPIGFCASGYIDLMAVLLRLGLLTEHGVLKKEFKISGFKITRMDIRKLQLGIGAIHTGVKFLIDYTGIEPSEIKMGVITGEFGSHLNVDSLKQIGMIPEGIKNITLETDLPLRGAIKLLLNEISPEEIEKIRKKSVHLELAMQKDFQKRFIDGLMLKPWN